MLEPHSAGCKSLLYRYTVGRDPETLGAVPLDVRDTDEIKRSLAAFYRGQRRPYCQSECCDLS